MKIIELKYLILISFILLSFSIFGCGKSSSNTINQEIVTESNATVTSDIIDLSTNITIDNNNTIYTFLTPPVTGVTYHCGTINALTDIDGHFTCPKDANISFSVGGINFGTLDSSIVDHEIIIPHDILAISHNNLDDIRLLNFIRLLQSFDEDNNASNGIVINQYTHDLLQDSYLDIHDTNITETDLIEIIKLLDDKVLVTQSKALSQYLTILKILNLYALPEQEPYYQYAWHLNSYESILNTIKGITINNHADINITDAWKITKGNDVKVAIIDTSFDTEHEDLKSNIIATYNVSDGTQDVSNHTRSPSHGNTCAGFIVSPINDKGSVGTAPEASLIAIKIQMENNQQMTSDIIKAFEYANAQGAKVISCSWGTEDISEALEYELQTLYNAGISILFATGNSGKTLDIDGSRDECVSEWVIGVGASGQNNDITSYSNYGEHIDLIAPGGDRTTSIGLLGIDDTGDIGQRHQEGLVNENYTFTYGTSFSTPITAGVVALMYSVNPNITPYQIKDILTQSADKVGGDEASYNERGFDEKRAYGKLNASKAVIQAQLLAQ